MRAIKSFKFWNKIFKISLFLTLVGIITKIGYTIAVLIFITILLFLVSGHLRTTEPDFSWNEEPIVYKRVSLYIITFMVGVGLYCLIDFYLKEQLSQYIELSTTELKILVGLTKGSVLALTGYFNELIKKLN